VKARLGLAVLVSWSVVVWAASTPRRAAAQSYFGQNQVQYDKFAWQILETEHFQIYFYPQEHTAAHDAARMAERAYARLSQVLDHQFREKKPIILFASRTDFGQNNVTGDLGEGTGGVTEALRHRMLLNFTGDYKSFEHVLTHEMVHAFQYDIFARGKAGNGLQALAQYMPPLWFAEGMAEYLSLGPSTTITTTWMRDAALNGRIPPIEQLTDKPDKYFPYRYGHSLWTYIGQKWGDETIGQIMNAVPTVGVERAFKRELGISLEDLGDEWREDLQTKLLPGIGNTDRPRKFAQPLLTARKSGGEIFLAPALSSDGKSIAFLSNGSLARGEVFIDLWLGDGETGKRTTHLIHSTLDANYEELRVLYSQSAFSPDGRLLAFTAQTHGKDALYTVDVADPKRVRRLDLPLEGVTGPTWSPDGRRLAFSGNIGGITDLFIVDADGKNLHRLTQDRYGDLQPQWSPDGTRLAFVSDRGDSAGFDVLRFPYLRITVFDLEQGTMTVLPGQAGLNINPQWSPDGKSLAYLSDRTGTANVFLYDVDTHEHYQLTNVAGAVQALTEYSPAISWARQADRLAFTYYENGDYTIWTVNNPRALRREPFRDKPPAPAVTANETKPASGTPTADATSVYRTATGELRSSADAPAPGDAKPTVSIVALLDSSDMALPDTTKFRVHPYRVRLQPDYVARPSIGYTPDAAYGRNYFGGTTIVMSDMLGNHHLALSGEVNGRLSESRLFLGYTNLGHRWQYSTGVSQQPYYFLSSDSLTPTKEPESSVESQQIKTYVARQAFAVTAYPLNRFTRVELGGGFNNIDRSTWFVNRRIVGGTAATPFEIDSTRRDRTLNYLDGQLALVSDNTLYGYTGPVMGRRYRVQVSPVAGSFDWIETLVDYRRYDPIIFNYLTVATRLYANISVGPDESEFPKYIARPDFVRGYDRSSSFYLTCPIIGANPSNCSAVQLLGSRVAVANAELRFPLIRRFELGILPMALPPLDGLFFYDIGAAWSRDQKLYASRPADYDLTTQRYPLRSYGFGLRLNLFNYAILRWDYAVPLDQGSHRGFWTWSLWPSF
jgi:WD40 repeat protein